ncbi:MAG: methyltransferase family protein [Bacteroidetes bacterium]|nr:MAG: methyltransferase family protein [Bacteroidota bacterium]
MVSNKEIVAFLKSKTVNAGFIDRLKIHYRPLICPFIPLFGYVKENDRVFDIGCGSGQFCLLLHKFTKPSSITGIEISERLVNNARQLFSSEQVQIPFAFFTFDGKTFPPELGQSDLVFLVDVLHHVPGKLQQDFLSGICKAMKPGARLVLKDINGASPLVLFNKLHDLVFARETGKERSVAQASAMAEKAGFKIRATFKQRVAVYPHYFIELEKQA